MTPAVAPKAAGKIIRSHPITKSLEKGFVSMGWSDQLPGVRTRSADLLTENAHLSKPQRMHMEQLLPMIAFYEAAQQIAGSREAALAFFEKWAYVEAEKMMKPVRGLMKLGLYRLMPALCGLLLDRMFGHAAGFDYRPVPDAPKFAVDMTRCPYVEACARYGCPELCQFACRADDITYGQLHPNLVWARTRTLGMGGECCDFRLYVKEKNIK
jgi:hypothetical protein